MSYIYENYDFDELDIEKLECSNLSQFKTDTVGFIAGFIVRKISAKLSCSECVSSLKASESDDPNLLIISRGSRLISPSIFVMKTAVTCEKVLSTELENNWLSKKYYFDFVQILICNSFVSLHSGMLRNLDCHSYELLKKIVACYVSLRFKSFAKKKNEELKKKRLRSKLSRMIIFPTNKVCVKKEYFFILFWLRRERDRK